MCLISSVGVGQPNRRADVKTVQVLLNINLEQLGDLPPLDVDGAWGKNTRQAIEVFQSRAMEMDQPSGRVDPDSPTLGRLREGIAPGFQREGLQGIMIEAPIERIETYFPPLDECMPAHGIDTPARQAHFLAQTGHESADLRYSEELASGKAYEGRKDLGNTQPGDGPRFKGRGLIQLTGRANYAAYGAARGADYVSGENYKLLASDPELAVDVACWFWANHGLNELADADDVIAITRVINGGLNGLAGRRAKLARAKFFLV